MQIIPETTLRGEAMAGKKIPETVENRWDILYRDYPEIYEEFARVPKRPALRDVIRQHFPLEGKTVVDVGSGTGRSSFDLAPYARLVIGVEPEAAMRQVAVELAGQQQIYNVRFMGGTVQHIPLQDDSVDIVGAHTVGGLHDEENIARFTHEAERVVRKGGIVFSADIASGWYGGDLESVIYRDRPGKPDTGLDARDQFFPQYGYECLDYLALQDYGTVDHIVQTYGFIFGRNAIDHIREHGKTIITWKINVHYKHVH
jgi:ubiquinone/menaquinone biosynthesis C-methylase UbiE